MHWLIYLFFLCVCTRRYHGHVHPSGKEEGEEGGRREMVVVVVVVVVVMMMKTRRFLSYLGTTYIFREGSLARACMYV